MFIAALLTKSNTWKQPTSMNEGMDKKNVTFYTHTHIPNGILLIGLACCGSWGHKESDTT